MPIKYYSRKLVSDSKLAIESRNFFCSFLATPNSDLHSVYGIPLKGDYLRTACLPILIKTLKKIGLQVAKGMQIPIQRIFFCLFDLDNVMTFYYIWTNFCKMVDFLRAGLIYVAKRVMLTRKPPKEHTIAQLTVGGQTPTA